MPALRQAGMPALLRSEDFILWFGFYKHVAPTGARIFTPLGQGAQTRRFVLSNPFRVGWCDFVDRASGLPKNAIH